MTEDMIRFMRMMCDGFLEIEIEPHAPALGLNGPPPDDTPIVKVRMITGYTEISSDPPNTSATSGAAAPAPWRTRARWRWHTWREQAGRKAGSWLAGVDLTERDEEW